MIHPEQCFRTDAERLLHEMLMSDENTFIKVFRQTYPDFDYEDRFNQAERRYLNAQSSHDISAMLLVELIRDAVEAGHCLNPEVDIVRQAEEITAQQLGHTSILDPPNPELQAA